MGANKKPYYNIGDIVENRHGSKAEVVFYESSKKVWVEFLDDVGYVNNYTAHMLRAGVFRNPFFPATYGIGFYGVLPVGVDKRGELYRRAQKSWFSMMARCYCDKLHKRLPTYKGCEVGEDWRNFSNFYLWCENNVFFIEGYQLDKDLLYKDNKLYSAETCAMVPAVINTFLSTGVENKGSKYLGVRKDKGYFAAVMSQAGVFKYLGNFKCEYEAHLCYKKEKELYAKALAEDWKGRIPDSIYNMLINWRLDDFLKRGDDSYEKWGLE